MLRRQGTHCGRTCLGRLIRQLGLQPLQKRRRRPRTTQSAHREPIAPNLALTSYLFALVRPTRSGVLI